MAGVEFLEKFQDPEYFMGVTNHLGFELDIKEIYNLLMADDVDELYDIQSDMKFTDIRKQGDKLYIDFEINGRAGRFDDNNICIDNMGRVYVYIQESPWEGGGICGEIEEIVMKYIASVKYK